MTRRSPLLAVAAVVAALTFSACSSSSDDTGDTSSADSTRTVATDYGEVEVPTDPQRVVVLNYALAGYLYNLDVPVTATVPEDADQSEGTFSEFWADEAEEDGTIFLPWSVDGYDLESILEQEPDLIIGGGIGFPLGQAEQVYDELTDIAPTVLVGRELQTWQDQFSFLAEDVFGQEDEYADLLTAYDDRVAEVKEAITPPEGAASYVSFTADGRPFGLVEDVGLPHELAAVGIEPAPVFAESDLEVYGAGGDMFEVPTERVGDTLTQPTMFVMGFNTDTMDVASLEDNPVYASLPSFENGQAFDLPYWALRGDYDEAMALLDIVEEQFG